MILQRYIGLNVLKGWLLVMVILGSVFGLISFTQELDRTNGAYDTLAAALYTLQTLPNQLVSLAPVIALLGSIVALAGLDRFNELTIISCTGFSRNRLLLAIALPTLAFMAVLWVSMEYVTPAMQQSAERERQALRYRNVARIPDGGVWSKNGHRYIHLDKMLPGGIPGDIDLYEFDNDGQLIRALHAQTAQVSPDRRWLFKGVREKKVVNGELETLKHKELEIANLWAADELPTLSLPFDSMTLSVLYRYAQYRADNGQPNQKYLAMFWQKLLMPLTVAAMVLLATPISANLGARRDRSFGLDIALGALIGILFYLGAQVVMALGQLLDLSMPLVALVPSLLVLVCAIVMLRRMHW